jgi:hypothetical protein
LPTCYYSEKEEREGGAEGDIKRGKRGERERRRDGKEKKENCI